MERRMMLQLAATLGMGAIGSSGPLSALADLTLTAEPRDLDDWHLACDDHLHGVRTRPPGQVRDDLVIDLLALGRQLKTTGAGDVTELRRVEAALATLHANVLTRLGDHGSAIRWWRTARTAADASGDLELRLGVRATETGHGLSGQRDPATVLRLTEAAQNIAGDSPSLGLALVLCSQAKALSMLGRHDEAQQALNACEDTFAAAEPMGIMPGYWQGGQLPFAEVAVHAHAGDEFRTDEAYRRVLASGNSDPSESAKFRLHEALCTVVNGGADAGARQATAVIETLSPPYRNHIIIETGRNVLRAVPVDKRDRPAVRELLALTSGHGTPSLP